MKLHIDSEHYIYNEVRTFSQEICERTIPSVIDGLKDDNFFVDRIIFLTFVPQKENI